MKYLSVCSGIEAASVAWHPLGWKPLAFSEIEKFPRKVLEHHYPDTPLHGDFTLLREQDWIKDADILVGGTPCQAFSVAGLRNSLDDDRGNLTLEFVRLADAIDDLRSNGTVIVWENVPGVLSVKDNAFGCFLGAIVGNDAPLVPTGGKWTNAGMVVGPKRRAAWRVLDAQYFGVAQRRRRVFVVASARDGFDPAEILFERQGLRRDTPPSRQKGLEPSATIAARFGISRNNHEEVVAQYTEEVSPTLTKEGTGVSRTGFQEDGWYVATCFDRQRSDEYGEANIASTISARDYKDATDLVAQPVPFGVDENPDLGHCLRSGASKADKHESTTYVAQPMAFREITDSLTASYGTKWNGNASADNGSLFAAQPIAIDYELNSHGVDQPTGPLLKGSPSGSGHPLPAVMQSMAVRRLTPRECERLQGFPDDYTAIPGAADGPRYKALGNSMAVPVMAWIGMRIKKYLQSNLDRVL